MAVTRNYKYKVLQDMDLSQNSIENPSLITNPSNMEIHSDTQLNENAPTVVIKDSSNKNTITVDSSHALVSGQKLDITSTNTKIDSTTEISKDLSITGETITATTPSNITIGNNNGITNVLGKELEIKSNDGTTESIVSAQNIEFTSKLKSNGFNVYWDDNRKSLVFGKETN